MRTTLFRFAITLAAATIAMQPPMLVAQVYPPADGGQGLGDPPASDASPLGYVVRGGAPAFDDDAAPEAHPYAALGWYRPWYFYGGAWLYRPFPYHAWYYRTYGFGRRYGWGRGWRNGFRRR